MSPVTRYMDKLVERESATRNRLAAAPALAVQFFLIPLAVVGVTVTIYAGFRSLVAAFQLAAVSEVKLIVTRPSKFAHRQLWVTGLLGLFGNPQPFDELSVPTEEPAISGT